jgi:hypothetical protein
MHDIVAHLDKLLSQSSQTLLKGKGDDTETDSFEQNSTALPIHYSHDLFGLSGPIGAGTRLCSSCTLESPPNERLVASFVGNDSKIKVHNKRKFSELFILQLWSKHMSLKIPLGPGNLPQKKQKLEPSSQCDGNGCNIPSEKRFAP